MGNSTNLAWPSMSEFFKTKVQLYFRGPGIYTFCAATHDCFITLFIFIRLSVRNPFFGLAALSLPSLNILFSTKFSSGPTQT